MSTSSVLPRWLALAVFLAAVSGRAASFLTPPDPPAGQVYLGQCSPFGPPGEPPSCEAAEGTCPCQNNPGPPPPPPRPGPSPGPNPVPGFPNQLNSGFAPMHGIASAGVNRFYIGHANAYRMIPDLALEAGAGQHRLAFTRYHNSRFVAGPNYFGSAGHWRHAYQWELTTSAVTSNSQLEIDRPDGRHFSFGKNTDTGLWEPTSSYYPELAVSVSQTGTNLTLQTSQGWQYDFGQEADGAGGYIHRFLRFRDALGVTYSVTTDASYRVTQVTEPAGRNLQITYQDGKITQVSASDGRSVTYTYETYEVSEEEQYPALVTVSYPGGPAAHYQYYDAYPLLLATMDDPAIPGPAGRLRYEYWNYSGDARGAIWREVSLDSAVEFARLESTASVATVVNHGQHTNSYELNGFGIASKFTNALGAVVQYESLLRYPISMVDALGYTNYYTNSLLGNLLSYIRMDQQGNVIRSESWGRDDFDLMLTHTNTLGHVTTYTRDTNTHRVTRVDHPDTTYETFAYNSFGQVTQHRLTSGGTNSYAYSTNALCTHATNALGFVTAYAYDAYDRLASMTDARGNTNGYTYDSRGYLVKVTQADGSWVGFGYDNYGNRIKQTNELGKIWTWNFNELSQMTNAVDPLSRTTTYEYSFGEGGCCGGGGGGMSSVPTKIITPSGRTNVFEYDAVGRKSAEIVAYGTAEAATNRFEYDAVGNLTNRIDALGNSWKNYHNALNQRIAIVDPLDRTNSWTYDALGNKLSETRPDNTTTTYGYDSMSRLIATTNALNQVVRYGYDVLGNLISLVDTKGNTNQWTYGLLGHRLSKTYADSTQDRYAYDAVGNLAYFTNAASEVQTLTYDGRNRPTLKSWSTNGDTEAMTYDSAGRLLTLTNSISVLTNAYDDANQLIAEGQLLASQSARVVSYTYNADGKRLSLTYPGGNALTNTYNARGLISGLYFDGPPPLASFTYDAAGQRTVRAFENGVNTYYTNDAAGQLVALAHVKTNGGSVLVQINYGYNAVANPTNRMESFTGFNSATDVYAYDSTDQLTNVNYSGGARVVGYNYDPMGNLTNKLDNTNTTTFTANNLNQLATLNGTNLTYDAKGSLLTRPGWSYTWNAKNQLTVAEQTNPAEGSKKMTFAYDGKNRCAKRRTYTYTSGNWSLTLDTCLYYDKWNLVEERDGSGSVIAAFANGPVMDEILAKLTSTNTVFYHGDAQNSTLVLTDASANVAERYRYDAFGLPSLYDSTFSPLSSSLYGIRHLFQGREWLAEVKLNDHRNRHYSPEMQRWISRDPIQELDDIHLYRFVFNSPASLVDPTGLFGFLPCSRKACEDANDTANQVCNIAASVFCCAAMTACAVYCAPITGPLWPICTAMCITGIALPACITAFGACSLAKEVGDGLCKFCKRP